ncbi:MAG TPA: DUF6268 family outer membrane beta-barrel protein [Bacteroidia bacterium]|nr:DUF6268 family outer membrane beta-barrel protein [Bacteroidia bacterium]
MKLIKPFLLISITFILFHKISAQDRKFLSPQIKLSGEYVIPSGLKDTSGEFSVAKSQLGFVYPLMSRRYSLTNDLGYRSMVVLANFNAGYALPFFTFIDSQHQLVNGTLGASIIYNSGNKNTWLGGFNAGIAEDIKTLSSYSIRYTGHVLFKHKVNGNFSYHAGFVYSFVYGRGLPLPILGCIIRTGDKSKLKITLPLSISYMLKTNEFNMLTFFIQPDGNAYQFATLNDTFFYPNNDAIVKFRSRNIKLGANYKMASGDRFHFTPEIGYSLKRNISFSEGSFSSGESFFKGDLKPAPYIKVSLRILIGDLKWKRTGDNFLLNDERLDYYDLDDPTKL